MKHFARALRFFRPEGSRLGFVLMLLLGATGAGLLKPWPLAILVDSVLGSKQLPSNLAPWLDPLSVPGRVALLAGATLVLHVTQSLLAAWQNHLLIGAGLSGLARVRNAVFQHLQRLAPGFHQRMSAGDLIYRATWDTYAFQTLFQHGLFAFISAALSLALMVAVMGRINLPLTCAALATVPVLLIVMSAFSQRMGRASLAAHAADSGVTSAVQQTMAALPLVQLCRREESEARRFSDRVDAAFQARKSQHAWEVLYLALIGVIFGMGTTVILWLGASAVIAGTLSVGTLLVFLAYLGQFYEPLNQLSRVGAILSDAGAGTRRVLEILDSTDTVREPAHGHVPTGATRGALSFEGVSFGYESGRSVLISLNLSVAPGEHVALVGPSGAGKTTLLHLLPRFRDPVGGTIRLDGVELREWNLGALRSCMALVFQDPIILPSTVAENIGYGRPGAPRDAIEAAARAAGADEFILRLPEGYETVLGDGAQRLSAGERQRLSLARVFLQDAPILLLDEPTSSLDAESERSVSERLARLMRGRTTVLVAHRAGSLPKPDRVICLNGGSVQATGTPDEIAARDPGFARAFRSWLETNKQETS